MRLNKLLLLLAAFFLGAKVTLADVAEGEKLFNANCTSCHAINEKVVGPALKDVDKRHNEAWLIKWIKNSQAMVKSGDAEALKIYNEYNQSVMTAFPQFSDGQVKSILEYVKTGGAAPAQAGGGATAPTDGAAPTTGEGFYSQTMLIGLSIFAVILLFIIFILVNIRKVIERIYNEKFPEELDPEDVKLPWKQNKKSTRYKLFVKHPVVGTLAVGAIITLVLGLYGFDFANKKVGVQKGYAPVQPINYSHELHAGKYKINCQYCHTGAYQGKQATIPSLNVCMNCHMAINEYKGEKMFTEDGEEINGTQEIEKLYKYAGFEPGKPWDPSKAKPIEWVRIHNLPDHVYFNHAQHVKAGQVACQTCHGEVQEMEVLAQHAPLSMGWCISCHREKEVNYAQNDYYKIYKKYHDKISEEGGKFTVEKIGGTECQKCHY
jgi:mono/diheme cytochrome c family protein